jgi:hypothetical protein
MKQLRGRPNDMISEDRSPRSLHEFYDELLYLREQVRVAELLSGEGTSESEKVPRKTSSY